MGLTQWRRSVERLLLKFQAGMEIDLGRIHRLMTEPHRNDGAVDAAMQQGHGGGVPQPMRGDVFVDQRRALLARLRQMLLQEIGDGIPTEDPAAGRRNTLAVAS